ncbi:TlpA family protein disulfide reductase [Alicyclobacillus dauci]|uniref:Thioredoxin domain-containing protein n=1 Tax=Alicyclobacillus dauci TaxID=1475485 RepID=A0ABY6YXH9_9BACL|nr:hypothetical protein [Alicyclobacillus dauci]WAH35299.1 hypothetical protein NZD86_13375 [Alicyclobacillus dauci]
MSTVSNTVMNKGVIRLNRLFTLISSGVLSLLLASGCATVTNGTDTTTNGTSAAKPKLAFQNRTRELVVTPDTKVDPSPATDVDYTHVSVLTAAGKRVVLDARQTPILFVAYWCPHCQRTLELLSSHKSELSRLPVIVNVGFPKNTELQEAVQVEAEETKQLNLHGFQMYYALDPAAGDKYAPQGYPTLAYENVRGIQTLFGEHTLSVWTSVLGL